MPSSIAFDFVSIFALGSFATFCGACGFVFANGLRLLEFPKNPSVRFLAGCLVIAFLGGLVNKLMQDEGFVMLIASSVFVGFCIRSFWEYAVREHENDMAFNRALAERSMKPVRKQTTNVVV